MRRRQPGIALGVGLSLLLASAPGVEARNGSAAAKSAEPIIKQVPLTKKEAQAAADRLAPRLIDDSFSETTSAGRGTFKDTISFSAVYPCYRSTRHYIHAYMGSFNGAEYACSIVSRHETEFTETAEVCACGKVETFTINECFLKSEVIVVYRVPVAWRTEQAPGGQKWRPGIGRYASFQMTSKGAILHRNDKARRLGVVKFYPDAKAPNPPFTGSSERAPC